MHLSRYIYGILLLSLLWSCTKDPMPDPPPPPEQKKVIEIQWATRLEPDKSVVHLNNGLVWKDYYLYTGDDSEPPKILAWDTRTGEKAWEYVHQGEMKHDIAINKIVDDRIYIAVGNGGMLGYDLEAQELLWEIDYSTYGYSRGQDILVKGNKVYSTMQEHTGNNEQFRIHIMEVDVYTGAFKPVYSQSKAISPPAFVNEDVIIFNLYPSEHHATSSEYLQSILAYDIKKQEVLWQVDSFTNYGSNGIHPVLVDGDKVYTGGAYRMYAFDVHTGKELWQTPVPDRDKFNIFTNTNHLLKENRLYVNEVGFNLTCLDTETGEILWNNKDAPNSTDNMTYYKDMIVFTSWGYGSVMVVDALTGKTLGSVQPYEDKSFRSDPVYDPKTDMFFASTYRHAVGLKIQRPD